MGFLISVFCVPGGDLLFRALRQSTIGAAAFHGRVRDGIGWDDSAMTTRQTENSLVLASIAGGRIRDLRLPSHKLGRPFGLASPLDAARIGACIYNRLCQAPADI